MRAGFIALGIILLTSCAALAQDVGLINAGHVMGNGGSSAGAPTDAALTNVMNHGTVTGGDLGAGKLNLSNGYYVLGGAGNAGGAQWTGSAMYGAYEYGQGSVDDWAVANKSGTIVCGVATGGTTINCSTLTLTNPLSLANGGTNASLTASNGGIFYSTASAGAILQGTATVNLPLVSGASTTPSWAPVAYLTSTATSGGLAYFSSTTQMASSALLAANGIMIGGGAGAAPSSIAACTNGQLVVGATSASPACQTIGGDVSSITSGGSVTLGKLNGVTYPSGPSANTVPVVTSAAAGGTVTYEALPNSALANSSITVAIGASVGISTSGCGPVALGGTCTLSATTDTVQWTSLGLGGAAPATGAIIYNALVNPGANGQLALGASAAKGGVIAGQGSTSDLTLANKSGGTVCSVATGGTTINCATLTLTNALTLANGGTGQTTANAARQASGLNVLGDQGTAHGDANATIGNTERMAYTNAALTAARTWTLPAANVTGAPYTILIADLAGGASGANTITAQRAGADTVNGGTTVVLINAAFGSAVCSSDGSSRWDCQQLAGGGAGSGTVTSAACDGVTITTSGTCPPRFSFANCSLAASVAGNNLTINIKDNTGADPSATSPCSIWFRGATASSGSWTRRDLTAATSFTANAGSSFGVTNTGATCVAASSCPFRLWVVAVDTGSTAAIGVIYLTNASTIAPLAEFQIITSTACSACINATALGTVYSTAAQTSKPLVILGYLEWGSGLATAGTYASGPTVIQTMAYGVPRPGEVIQTKMVTGGSLSTTATTPQTSTTTGTITPQSAANIFRVTTTSNAISQNSTQIINLFLYNAPTTFACTNLFGSSTSIFSAGGQTYGAVAIEGLFAPGSTTTQAFGVCGDVAAGGSLTYPASGTPQLLIEELMGSLTFPPADNDNDPSSQIRRTG